MDDSVEIKKESGSASACIQDTLARLQKRVSEDVFGQDDATKVLTMALLVGGHVLLEGPPGVAKTLLAKTFARATGLSFNRIQFTPDLMPSDITGVYIYDQAESSFRLSAGPVFADVVLADEINRTPPKTQSALLEAMQEHFVTIDGKRHPLGEFFFVIATQNPIEHEGTYPLPEAQLDRFFVKLNLSYPDESTEVRMIQQFSEEDPMLTEWRTSAPENERKRAGVISLEQLVEARARLREIYLEESVARYIRQLAEATRRHPDVLLGASPRAALHLSLAAKCNAAYDNREYVIPDDVKAQARTVLLHRLILRPEILPSPERYEKLMTEILATVAIPKAESQLANA